eukprot:5546459-Pyramimonas_sp.AAC.1
MERAIARIVLEVAVATLPRRTPGMALTGAIHGHLCLVAAALAHNPKYRGDMGLPFMSRVLLMSVLSMLVVHDPGLLPWPVGVPAAWVPLPALQDLLQCRADDVHTSGAGYASAPLPRAPVLPTLEAAAGARAVGRSVVRHVVASFIGELTLRCDSAPERRIV